MRGGVVASCQQRGRPPDGASCCIVSTRMLVGGCLQPGAVLVLVCLTVVTLQTSSTTPTVAGCRLVGCSVVSRLPLCSHAVVGVSQHV